jgi:hypothetical protein
MRRLREKKKKKKLQQNHCLKKKNITHKQTTYVAAAADAGTVACKTAKRQRISLRAEKQTRIQRLKPLRILHKIE